MKLMTPQGRATNLPLKITFCVFLTSTLTGCFYQNVNLPIECDYKNTEFYNDSPSVEAYSEAKWNCDEDNDLRTLEANGVPNHPVDNYRRNGGWLTTVIPQKILVHVTYEPELTKEVKPRGGKNGALGYALNGIKIDPGSGGTCKSYTGICELNNDDHEWTVETLGQTFFNYQIDENNGHIQPDGVYHYHGVPYDHVEEIELRQPSIIRTDMTLFGWALDGHAIYAEYGSNYDHTTLGGYRKMKPSYQLVEPVSESRPSVDIYPLGTFREDWEYVKGSGDLDECNGIRAVTSHFKDITYHYIATKEYPYVPRCVKGYLDFPLDQQPPSANSEPSAHR